MTTARIVLLIALLLPLLGRAQEAASGSPSTEAEAASEGALSPPPLLSAPPGKDPSLAKPPKERHSLAARMALQTPLVIVGALAGGAAGLGAVELIGSQGNEREDHRVALSLVGGALGAAGAAYGGGAILGMDGSLLYTLLGAGVGLAIPSIGLLTGLARLETLNDVSLVVMLVIAGLACPVAAYELSHAAAQKDKAASPSAARPRVYPVFAATSGGGALGLAGTF
jgi:hypothetical protein